VCACYVEAKLFGFWALAGEEEGERERERGGEGETGKRLERGPAYAGVRRQESGRGRADDGQLVWRFRAAPEDRRAVACEQVESLWPVCGSVLVQGGVAYVAAGRSSYLDGGIYLFGLDPATGEVLYRSRVETPHPKLTEEAVKKAAGLPATKLAQNIIDGKSRTDPDRSDSFAMGGTRRDVLVSDGTSIYLRHVRFDAGLNRQPTGGRHLYSTTALLDGSEVHRTHWVLGLGDLRETLPVSYSWIANRMQGGFGSRLAAPYGLLLCFDGETVWGIRRTGGYTLFAQQNKPFSPGETPPPDFRPSDGKTSPPWKWSAPLPFRPRALVRAGEALWIAGVPNVGDSPEPFAAFEGRAGGLLAAFSTADGTELARYDLDAAPVFDGMAAAGGQLLIATVDGEVRLLGKQ